MKRWNIDVVNIILYTNTCMYVYVYVLCVECGRGVWGGGCACVCVCSCICYTPNINVRRLTVCKVYNSNMVTARVMQE